MMESQPDPATTENDSSREEGHIQSETTPLLQKRASDVTGKIISTNFALLIVGLNGTETLLLTRLQPED